MDGIRVADLIQDITSTFWLSSGGLSVVGGSADPAHNAAPSSS